MAAMDAWPGPRGRGWLSACVVTCVAFASAEVHAIEHPLRESLTVEGGGCLTRDALAKEVVKHAGIDQVDARIRIEVRETPARRRASFILYRKGGASSVRELDHLDGSCPEIVAAVGVSIAVALQQMLLDAPAVDSSGDPLKNEDVGQEKIPPADDAPPRALAQMSAVRRGGRETRPTFAVDVEPAVLLGALPGPAIAGALLVDVGIASTWHARGGVFGAVAPSRPFAAGAVNGQLLAGRLDICQHVPISSIVVAPCAGAFIGYLRVAGEGYSSSLEQTLPWVAPLVGLHAYYPIGPDIRITSGFDVAFPLLRPRLETADREGVLLVSKALPAIALSATIGVRYTFR